MFSAGDSVYWPLASVEVHNLLAYAREDNTSQRAMITHQKAHWSGWMTVAMADFSILLACSPLALRVSAWVPAFPRALASQGVD